MAFVNSLTLVPLSVALLCSVSIEGIGKGICKVLGELSYPLYVIHFPIYRLVFESFEIRRLNPVAQTLIGGWHLDRAGPAARASGSGTQEEADELHQDQDSPPRSDRGLNTRKIGGYSKSAENAGAGG